ncbi:MAG: hypothetical protein PHQ96_00700 [Candidatus Omnitrophica bacterium]|nr:hypothetical protein [Candidatus Omnitrophota bacterium]
MGSIVVILVLIGVALIVIMLRSPKKENGQEGAAGASEDKLHLENEAAAIKDERDKLKADVETLKNELQEIKKEDSDLRDQLARAKEGYAKNQETLSKCMKENQDLKDKLAQQQKAILKASVEAEKVKKQPQITPASPGTSQGGQPQQPQVTKQDEIKKPQDEGKPGPASE